MKLPLVLTAVAVAAATLTATAPAHLPGAAYCSARQPAKVELRCASRDQQHALSALRWFRNHPYAGTVLVPAKQPRGHRLAALRLVRVAKPVRRVAVGNHRWLLHEARTRVREAQARLLAASVPTSWLASVRWVQRIWPGSERWLLDCSSSEGGWGGWVPNTSGSGAGGWMQYMSGTFWHDYVRAAADARSRGFPIPRSSASWGSALGQAVAAGWAYYHDRPAGKWTGRRC